MNTLRIRFAALILRRYSDDDIIAALAPVYRAIVHDDPSFVAAPHLPAAHARRHAGSRDECPTLAQLDAWLGPNWSIRNG
jgi:hypothetical protein